MVNDRCSTFLQQPKRPHEIAQNVGQGVMPEPLQMDRSIGKWGLKVISQAWPG